MALTDAVAVIQRTEPTIEEIAEIAAAIARTITVTSDRWPRRPAEHPTDRTGVRVLTTEQYDVWLLRWLTGTGVTPHDHGESMGAFCVVRGSLLEVRWEHGGRTARTIDPTQTLTIGRGIVHDVIGAADGSLSVHVYSPPLSRMNFYDADATVVVGSEQVDTDAMVEPSFDRAGGPVDAAGASHR